MKIRRDVPGVAVEVDQDAPAGAFELLDGNTYLAYMCPCGCGEPRGVPITQAGPEVGRWRWNGDCERPTLTPSIRHLDGCRYHGYITGGVWRFAGDSGR